MQTLQDSDVIATNRLTLNININNRYGNIDNNDTDNTTSNIPIITDEHVVLLSEFNDSEDEDKPPSRVQTADEYGTGHKKYNTRETFSRSTSTVEDDNSSTSSASLTRQKSSKNLSKKQKKTEEELAAKEKRRQQRRELRELDKERQAAFEQRQQQSKAALDLLLEHEREQKEKILKLEKEKEKIRLKLLKVSSIIFSIYCFYFYKLPIKIF